MPEWLLESLPELGLKVRPGPRASALTLPASALLPLRWQVPSGTLPAEILEPSLA